MTAWRRLLIVCLVAACAAPLAPPTPTPDPTATAPLPPSPASATTAPATPTAEPTAPTIPTPTPGQPAPPTPTPAPTPTPVALPDDSAWTRLEAPDGPSAREDHTWTVGVGDAAFLFGGRAGQRAFADLWRYELATDSWTQLEPPGTVPPARFGHVAAWHDELGLVIWSGQASATVFFADAWAYDPQANEWRELPSRGAFPIARYGSCGGIGPDGRLWISHGFTDDEGRFGDTQAYDFASGEWTDYTTLPRPVERCLHGCFWTADGRLILYAGQATGLPALGDLWVYQPGSAAWEQQASPPAPSRQLYGLAVLGDAAYVFGGGSVDRGYLDDVWRLTLDDLAWTELTPAGDRPSDRSGAALIADPARARLLLFGGKRRAGELADLWVLAAAGG